MADRADDRPQRRGPHLLADSARFRGGGECSWHTCRETIDSERRLVAALRSAALERGGPLPSIAVADAWLDERRELTEWATTAGRKFSRTDGRSCSTSASNAGQSTRQPEQLGSN